MVMYGGEERCIQSFGGNPEGYKPFGRPRFRWKANIKIELQELRGRGLDWVDLA